MSKHLTPILPKGIINFSMVFFCLYFGACQEYTSFYPVAKPVERTTKSPVLGNWQSVSSININKPEESVKFGDHFLKITPFSELEYLVQIIPDTLESYKDIESFRGFTSTFDQLKLANISPIVENGTRPVFVIYKYQIKSDSLIFWGISEEQFNTFNLKFESIKEHKKWILSQAEKLNLWDKKYSYVRKVEKY